MLDFNHFNVRNKLVLWFNDKEKCIKSFGHISDWDVSDEVDFSYLFYGKEDFNEDINSWNVSNVTTMECMFSGCKKFNKPLNKWNVSNVVNMENMFNSCFSFNQSLIDWKLNKLVKIDNITNLLCKKRKIQDDEDSDERDNKKQKVIEIDDDSSLCSLSVSSESCLGTKNKIIWSREYNEFLIDSFNKFLKTTDDKLSYYSWDSICGMFIKKFNNTNITIKSCKNRFGKIKNLFYIYLISILIENQNNVNKYYEILYNSFYKRYFIFNTTIKGKFIHQKKIFSPITQSTVIYFINNTNYKYLEQLANKLDNRIRLPDYKFFDPFRNIKKPIVSNHSEQIINQASQPINQPSQYSEQHNQPTNNESINQPIQPIINEFMQPMINQHMQPTNNQHSNTLPNDWTNLCRDNVINYLSVTKQNQDINGLLVLHSNILLYKNQSEKVLNDMLIRHKEEIINNIKVWRNLATEHTKIINEINNRVNIDHIYEKNKKLLESIIPVGSDNELINSYITSLIKEIYS